MKKKFTKPTVNFVELTPHNSIMSDVLTVSGEDKNINYNAYGFSDSELKSDYNIWKGFSE